VKNNIFSCAKVPKRRNSLSFPTMNKNDDVSIENVTKHKRIVILIYPNSRY
jgi:hypothetical protein